MRLLLAALAATVLLAGCGSTATIPAPAKTPTDIAVAKVRAIFCRTVSCAVRRQTLVVLTGRRLKASVEVACTGAQPSLCRILIAGQFCFAETASWFGGMEVDEEDTIRVSPAVCRAVFNRVDGA